MDMPPYLMFCLNGVALAEDASGRVVNECCNPATMSSYNAPRAAYAVPVFDPAPSEGSGAAQIPKPSETIKQFFNFVQSFRLHDSWPYRCGFLLRQCCLRY